MPWGTISLHWRIGQTSTCRCLISVGHVSLYLPGDVIEWRLPSLASTHARDSAPARATSRPSFTASPYGSFRFPDTDRFPVTSDRGSWSMQDRSGEWDRSSSVLNGILVLTVTGRQIQIRSSGILEDRSHDMDSSRCGRLRSPIRD